MSLHTGGASRFVVSVEQIWNKTGEIISVQKVCVFVRFQADRADR
jgi:hypothetical protein